MDWRTDSGVGVRDSLGSGLGVGVALAVVSGEGVAPTDGASEAEGTATGVSGVAPHATPAARTTASATTLRFTRDMVAARLGVGLGGRAEDRDCYQGDRKSRRAKCRSDPDHLRHAAIPLISH